MKMRYCIYKFIDRNNEIIYIGKTCSINPQLRFNQHSCNGHLGKECYDSIDRIEICELNSHADVNVYEPYLINIYKPKYNDDFKTEDALTIQLPIIEWMNKDEYIAMIKIENDITKNTIKYQENKADSRINKGIAYTKFKNWLDVQISGMSVKAKDLLLESELDTGILNGLKKSNTFVREWFKTHTVKKGNYLV